MFESTARAIPGALLALSSLLVPAHVAGAQEGTHLSTTARLSLRPTPDTLHTPLRVLPRGTELLVIAPDSE